MTQDPLPSQASLDRELDRVKTEVFAGSNAAFMAPLLCTQQFYWTETIETAATDGLSIVWNPRYFLKLPLASRKTDLMHELRHVAYMHPLRGQSLDHELFNIACDIKIDLELEAEGYSFDGIDGVLTNPKLDARRYAQPRQDANGNNIPWIEEDIYDDLKKRGFQTLQSLRIDILPPGSGNPEPGQGTPSPAQAMAQMLQNVMLAVQQAKAAKGAGDIPGNVEEMLYKFLKPVVPWHQVLFQFFTDLVEGGLSWKRPNKRIMAATSVFLPSIQMEEEGLDLIHFYEDTSGSMTEADVLRVNSEVKYCWDEFQPKKMKLIQFDTHIRDEHTYVQGESFDQVKVVGRGGTSLQDVRKHIMDHRPTAVIIFSDLDCDPMEPLPFEVPVIWIAIGNQKAKVPFGKLVHVKV